MYELFGAAGQPIKVDGIDVIFVWLLRELRPRELNDLAGAFYWLIVWKARLEPEGLRRIKCPFHCTALPRKRDHVTR